MNDDVLKSEVLELTLAHLRGDASGEEHARLERLLSDNPDAVLLYLQVVDDTLTLYDAAAAGESTTTSCANMAANLTGAIEAEPVRRPAGRTGFMGRHSGTFWAFMSIAGLLLILAGTAGFWWRGGQSTMSKTASGDDWARIVDISNVAWSAGSEHFDEWSIVEPGDTLKFESGWINLFLANGAELLIEGPADVEFVSLQNVFARQGKLAARVGPGAVGFRIDTPHAQVTDRGTAFGISVDGDSRTSVVVYEGKVDLDVLGKDAPPRRRMQTGEALSVDRRGQLSRITTVQSAEFLEPPKMRVDSVLANRVITAVTDNVRSLETAKYYRVIPNGFKEDCRAYVDRLHEWNGLDERKLPAFLLGGDYVMTFNDDKITTEIQIAVDVGQPANVYVLIDDRVPPPEWLSREFVDTQWDVGCDEGWEDKIIANGVGPGNSIDHRFSVWRRIVPEATTVVLGPLSYEHAPPPASSVLRSMYGIVVVPLRGGGAGI